jgi:hypothetical protein
MKKFAFAAVALLSLLGGCASGPQATPSDEAARAACRNTDAPTGSHLVRRNECAPASKS